jgi:uracil-DNA glycosylase
VLLLNAVLTVRAGEANSHKNKGWEVLTDKIIDLLARREKPMVFMLWGGNAAAKARFVREPHLLLKAPHPSPLSAYRGFFGCRHFSAANNFLVSRGFEPIDWSVEDNS